ncbi:MAG: alcohol dehydrogenase catalytic domain-containing protein [Lapillicoccus sp.]
MRAAVVTRTAQGKELRVAEVAAPVPGEGQVLVRVTRAGICGSDTHGFLDDAGTARGDGLIMSHEIGGMVAAVGAGVTGLPVGARVHVDPQVVCGRCEPCRSGWISICDHKRVLGSSLRGFVHGGLAELVLVQADAVYLLPDAVTDDQAPLIEPLANAVHVLERLQVTGQSVLVLGAGPLGLAMVEAMASRGVPVIIVSDTSAAKRAIAADAGATATIDPLAQDVPARVRELVGPAGIDITIEAVGIEVTYRQAIEATRKRGSIGFFGAVAAEVSLPLLPILHKELHLVGCTGANRADIRLALEMVADGRVRFRGWPIRTVGLSEAEEAIRALADPQSRTVKVLVDPLR